MKSDRSFREFLRSGRSFISVITVLLLGVALIFISSLDRSEDEKHSVREFCDLAFKEAGITLEFRGEGAEETGVCVAGPAHLVGKTLVEVSPDFYRPTDVVNLWGDPTKAKKALGWNPAKTSFEELVKLMVRHDMQKVAADHAAEQARVNLAEYLERGIVK